MGAGVRRVLAAVLSAVVIVGAAGSTAMAAPTSGQCATPSGMYTDTTPWPQKLFAPNRIWPLTTGKGQLVAIVGTGVDAGNGQFRAGQIRPGVDVRTAGATATATDDCDGRGTFAAGIIAANPHADTTFSGLAPGADLLPIRYTATMTQGQSAPDPKLLAAAIRAATARKATVICVAVPARSDDPSLRSAVDSAVAAGIVVVSGVAQGHQDGGARSYPTADPDVLGVSAIGRDGAVVSPESGDYLDVAAPGVELVSTAAGANGKLGHSWPVSDTAYAAAYVAGVVALVRAYRPQLTVREVMARVEATAARSIVDPYSAVAVEIPGAGVDSGAADVVQVAQPVPDPAAERRRRVAFAAAGMLVAALVLTVAVAVIRRGQRRGWVPGHRSP